MPTKSAPKAQAAYLTAAQSFLHHDLSENKLQQEAASLPELTHRLLAQLATTADTAALSQPAYGWAIIAVAYAAAGRQPDQLLQGIGAWHLARMSNEWVRPQRVRAAIDEARARFATVGEQGWLAACEWQLYALPWIHNDFGKAEATLERALHQMNQPGFQQFLAPCQASLAYAQLLNLKREKALENIDQSEQFFRSEERWLDVARCLVTRAEIVRRQGHFEQAVDIVNDAIGLIDGGKAPIDLARARYRRAQILVLGNRRYEEAEADLIAARKAFKAADLPVWVAQTCSYGLARLYRDTGRLVEAGQVLDEAREIYQQHQIPGLHADNLLDSGKFAKYRGQYHKALSYYSKAESLYRDEMGYPLMAAVTLMYQGEAHAHLGRYQLALSNLERAEQQFRTLKHDHRLAECQLRLAEIWMHLKQPEEVLLRLRESLPYFQRAAQHTFLSEYYFLLAAALLNQGRGEEAVTQLSQALATLPIDEIRPTATQLRRYLGEVLVHLERSQEALVHLQKAQEHFSEMGMASEEASCWVALGRCYFQLGRLEEAQRAWQHALILSGNVLPEIRWRVHNGMAAVAESSADHQKALQHYREAVSAISQLRRWFWQSSLAGSFLQEPSSIFDSAISLAARHPSPNGPDDVLSFIEESKAQTSNRQLSIRQEGRLEYNQSVISEPTHTTLEIEIRAMQDEILQSVYANPGFIRPAAEIRLRQQFLEKVQHYYRQSARIQRQNWSEQHVNDPIATDFDLAQFRALASQQIGHDNWLALDYYLTDDALYGAVVTPDDHFVFTNSISGVILRSLHRFPSAPAEQIATDLFAQLGMWLLPDAVQSLLDPETHLLIAPHKQLHQLPWAALPVSAEQKLLVNSCIPSIVPSLSTLYSLWLRFRDNAEPEEHSEALLLALSEFNGRYPPLPEVDVEAEAIGSMPGLNVKKLQQEQATWGALRDLSNGHGLSQFSFWHIATHAFHDAIAGRLSGIAVYDRDIWIDYLWQCAPLPHLVTLSACSGNRSKLYAGDEQVGLASTCLAAGAQTIIGSLRPIQDLNAARLMVDFYNYYIGGNSAAQALVLAQRSALAQGTATDWAFFTCIGAPTTKIK